MSTVAISGSSGFVGTNLVNMFEANGFEVIRISRDEISDIAKLTSIVSQSDIIVNLSGANIINRWTEEYKKVLYSSRLDTTSKLVEAIKSSTSKPKLFISTSAIGIYEDINCNDEYNYTYSDSFLAKLCQDWENEALRAKEFDVRTVIFRFGIVLGKNGGALEKMLTPFKLGLGGTIGNGKQDFSFIHIEDLLNAYNFVIENVSCKGAFNLTAPIPTTNKGLTRALGKALKKPTLFPVPNFVLNLVFSEGAQVLTKGQCVKPKKLLEAGFEFNYENIDDSIKSLI